MITVYGADWCEDTRRSRRHLRRLGIVHQYVNIDEDSVGLERAVSLNGGKRRTPTIDLGVGSSALVEPSNEMLTEALVELEMLTQDDAHDRLSAQNIGDLERALRAGIGTALVLAASAAPRSARWPLRIIGAAVAISGIAGWSALYHAAHLSSLDGPGDRPDEAKRQGWLIRV